MECTEVYAPPLTMQLYYPGGLISLISFFCAALYLSSKNDRIQLQNINIILGFGTRNSTKVDDYIAESDVFSTVRFYAMITFYIAGGIALFWNPIITFVLAIMNSLLLLRFAYDSYIVKRLISEWITRNKNESDRRDTLQRFNRVSNS